MYAAPQEEASCCCDQMNKFPGPVPIHPDCDKRCSLFQNRSHEVNPGPEEQGAGSGAEWLMAGFA